MQKLFLLGLALYATTTFTAQNSITAQFSSIAPRPTRNIPEPLSPEQIFTPGLTPVSSTMFNTPTAGQITPTLAAAMLSPVECDLDSELNRLGRILKQSCNTAMKHHCTFLDTLRTKYSILLHELDYEAQTTQNLKKALLFESPIYFYKSPYVIFQDSSDDDEWPFDN